MEATISKTKGGGMAGVGGLLTDLAISEGEFGCCGFAA